MGRLIVYCYNDLCENSRFIRRGLQKRSVYGMEIAIENIWQNEDGCCYWRMNESKDY